MFRKNRGNNSNGKKDLQRKLESILEELKTDKFEDVFSFVYEDLSESFRRLAYNAANKNLKSGYYPARINDYLLLDKFNSNKFLSHDNYPILYAKGIYKSRKYENDTDFFSIKLDGTLYPAACIKAVNDKYNIYLNCAILKYMGDTLLKRLIAVTSLEIAYHNQIKG